MIYTIVVNSLLIFGIHAITRPGMLLPMLPSYCRKPIIYIISRGNEDCSEDSIYFKAVRISNFIMKPLFDCPPCMASVWGIPFALLHPLSIWTLVYLFALSGFNYIIMKIISK
jgi:hypothetical protein